jgi:hypothetical protein
MESHEIPRPISMGPQQKAFSFSFDGNVFLIENDFKHARLLVDRDFVISDDLLR